MQPAFGLMLAGPGDSGRNRARLTVILVQACVWKSLEGLAPDEVIWWYLHTVERGAFVSVIFMFEITMRRWCGPLQVCLARL